jgi:hypothetical protein
VTYENLHSKFLETQDAGMDLQWRLLSLIDTLHYNQHRVVIFNTAEHGVDYWLVDNPKFDPIRKRKEVIDGLLWRSIPWQLNQGARWPTEDEIYPWDCRHVTPGDHKWLNEFLVNYINNNNILNVSV